MGYLYFKRAEVEAEAALVAAAGAYETEAWGDKHGPSLMLVGDQGVYLMGSQPRPPLEPGVKGYQVVYAEGCDPRTDEDFYQNKRDLFGGDDGAEYLTLKSIQAWLSINPKADRIAIRISETELVLA
jgi:hypothetical protein